jgi:peptide deformylase
MAILKIAQMGNPILRRVADPIDPEAITGHEVQHLIGEMYETMLDADGAGLAAPQVHCSVRLVICTFEDGVAVLINPVLTPLTQDLVRSWEGCLSVRGMRAQVDRVAKLNLEYYDQAGKRQNRVLEGWNAIVAQHECDHLDGILYIDRCDTKTLCFDREFERYRIPQEEE